jgi:UDP-N-acetylmuramoyl-tripeptide--D-alanyl-D-alanine ligase
MIRDLAELARVTGGVLHGAGAGFGNVTTDSRTLEPGSLFVALRGERFDGHDFVPQAVTRGAAGALVSRLVSAPIAQVVVPDTLEALTCFAHAWRRDFAGTVVGITGSNGKTTVKEMTGAILGMCGPCLVTQGNLNNHIGVPLTLARLDAKHRYAVIEMGANHQREIAHLASIAEPNVGLVINAGPAHLEGFGGIEGVARGKGEMFQALASTAPRSSTRTTVSRRSGTGSRGKRAASSPSGCVNAPTSALRTYVAPSPTTVSRQSLTSRARSAGATFASRSRVSTT